MILKNTNKCEFKKVGQKIVFYQSYTIKPLKIDFPPLTTLKNLKKR